MCALSTRVSNAVRSETHDCSDWSTVLFSPRISSQRKYRFLNLKGRQSVKAGRKSYRIASCQSDSWEAWHLHQQHELSSGEGSNLALREILKLSNGQACGDQNFRKPDRVIKNTSRVKTACRDAQTLSLKELRHDVLSAHPCKWQIPKRLDANLRTMLGKRVLSPANSDSS